MKILLQIPKKDNKMPNNAGYESVEVDKRGLEGIFGRQFASHYVNEKTLDAAFGNYLVKEFKKHSKWYNSTNKMSYYQYSRDPNGRNTNEPEMVIITSEGNNVYTVTLNSKIVVTRQDESAKSRISIHSFVWLSYDANNHRDFTQAELSRYENIRMFREKKDGIFRLSATIEPRNSKTRPCKGSFSPEEYSSRIREYTPGCELIDHAHNLLINLKKMPKGKLSGRERLFQTAVHFDILAGK